MELVVKSGQSAGEHLKGLASGPRLVRVEEEQNHISAVCIPLAHPFEVVATVHHGLLPSAEGVGDHGRVDHARGVDDHEVLDGGVGPNLQLGVVDELGTERAETGEAHVRVADEGRAVLVDILGARGDDGEGVIGGSHSGGLDLPLKDVVHETRLPRGVVAEKKHEG